MNTNKLIIVGGALLIIAVAAFITLGKKPSIPTTTQTPKETMVSPTPIDYSSWTYFKNGYGIKIPEDWQNTSDTGGTAVLEPGSKSETKLGTITKVSVTVLSDKKATGQRFTGQEEFDQWYDLSGPVQGDIQKVKNVTLDGEKAIQLMDNSGGDKNWLVIVWVRKDEVNLYITVNGTGKYTSADSSAIDYMVDSFRFEAPQTSDKGL